MSELIARVTTDDADLRMPPEGKRAPGRADRAVEDVDRRRPAVGRRLHVSTAELRTAAQAAPASSCRRRSTAARTRSIAFSTRISRRKKLPRPAADRRCDVRPPRVSRSRRPAADARANSTVVSRRPIAPTSEPSSSIDCSPTTPPTPSIGSRSGTTCCATTTPAPASSPAAASRSAAGSTTRWPSNMPYDQFARELIAPPTADSAGYGDGIQWRGDVSAGADRRDSIRAERRAVVPRHQPEVRLVPRQLHRSLEARRVVRPGGDLLDAAAGDSSLRQADRQASPSLVAVSRARAGRRRRRRSRSGLKQLAALLTHPGERPLHADDRQSLLASADGARHRASDRRDADRAVERRPARLPRRRSSPQHGYDLKHTLRLIATSAGLSEPRRSGRRRQPTTPTTSTPARGRSG